MKSAVVILVLATAACMMAWGPDDFYPLEVGNSWTMADSGEWGYDTTTTSIIGTEMFMGYQTYLMWDESDAEGDTVYYQMRPDGLYGLIFEDTTYIMELLFMPSSFSIGDTWTMFSQDSTWVEGGMDYEQNLTFTNCALAIEEVTVPAGTFSSCLKSQMDGSVTTLVMMGSDTMYYGSSGFGNLNWIAEDVGPVKSRDWDFDGFDTTWSYSVLVDYDLSNIEEHIEQPDQMSIFAWPNPFNSACRLVCPAGAEIEIIDINGREVDYLPPSIQMIRSWKPSEEIAGGVYFVRATVGNEQGITRVLFVK